MRFDDERTVITDADIEKRLKEKMRVNSRIFVLLAVVLLILAFSVYLITVVIRNATPSPVVVFEWLYLLVVTPLAVAVTIIELRKYLKEKKAQNRSHGAFTVTEDTITSYDVTYYEGPTRGRSRTYTYTVGLTYHDDYVTHNSELVGGYTEPGEKCWVVTYTDEPKTPILVYTARIYRYVKQ